MTFTKEDRQRKLDEVDRILNEVKASDEGRAVLETRGVSYGGRTPADEAFSHYLRTGDVHRMHELRADGTGFSSAPNDAGVVAGSTGNFAGYTVPQGFWRNLQIALKAYGGLVSGFRRVETPDGAPMPWPTIDPTAVTASILGASNELNPLSLQQPYNFGQGMLNAWTIAMSPILASLQLIQDSAFDVDGFVADRMGEAIGRELAALAVSGTGSGQPLGIVTALNAKGAVGSGSGGYFGLTAATAVKLFSVSGTELGNNVLAPQTLISMMQGVDPAYYSLGSGAKWYMNATQAWNTRALSDANGRPLIDFANGFNADNVLDPNYTSASAVGRLFGFDVIIDNNIPNLTASTTGGPVFGNLGAAMVYREVQPGTRVLRLDQRWADSLAVGYLGFMRVDVRSNDLRAAITCKPAAT